LSLQGMHRIDEAKFLALKAANHKALVEKGLMGRIYAHLFSLANFARLYDRAVRQLPQRKTPSRNRKS
jgi:SapC